MNFFPFIEAKREGQPLAPEQIQEFIREFTAGKIPDYQMAAMLMAIYFRGLDPADTTVLTLAMRDSGEVLKFPQGPAPARGQAFHRRHRRQGVAAARAAARLPRLPRADDFRPRPRHHRRHARQTGFHSRLPNPNPRRENHRTGPEIGCAICGQTDTMVPADKKLYALRDASGTVPSIPLITASILSKKLAESLDALILDVKFGCAAFMQTEADARKLAQAMVALGNDCGTNTRAILTDMNTPLGRAAGNWLEVKESVDCLENKGPADLRALVLECAAHLLEQTNKSDTLATARKLAEDCLDSGEPRKKWDEMLAAQGADLEAFNRKLAHDSTAAVVVELKSEESGYVAKCDARIIGEVIRDLGGGRLTQEAAINYDVGVDRIAKPGERVERFGVFCRVHAASQADADAAITRLKSAFEISVTPPVQVPLIAEIISSAE